MSRGLGDVYKRQVMFNVSLSYQLTGVTYPIYIRLSSYKTDSGLYILYQSEQMQTSKIYTVHIDNDFTISPGEKIIFNIVLSKSDFIYENIPVYFNFRGFGMPLSINFSAQDAPVNIDCIRPSVLLTRLLRTITGDNSVIGEITNTTDARLDKTVIAPAESIRGIPNAKIYTSYTKFANWMSSVFGFVPVIGDNKVTFVHRDVLFQDKLVKDLKDDTVDLNYSVSSSMIYSRLKVGYDKQDYDSVNGRDEFHFTNEYTTGITLTENAKELISPYRADAYGIEFLAAKRGEDTTDNDSDSDIFFVGAALEGGKYKLVRSGYTISGVISPSTMFNAMYSQRYMIEANARYLAAFAEQLSFTSSDGNSDVEINGVRETNDIALGNRLFTVGELSVETGDQGTPSDLSGYIRIEKNGNVYKGYVKSVSYNHGKAKPVKYSLIVKSVE